MANNLIQIKRSLTTSIPASLANGELAYTANGDILYIGSNAGIVAIAGKRVPGTLTANQAIVVNATSGVDKVIVANLVPTKISANGSQGSSGQLLAVDSGGNVYWSTPTASVAGSNTQVQFNDSGSLAGSAGFTFNKTTNNLTIANTVIVGNSTVNSTVGTTLIQVANSTSTANLNPVSLTIGTTVVNSSALAVGSAVVANATGVWTTGTVNAALLSVGATFTANATLVNTAAINVTGAVNTATLYAATSANVGSAVLANTSGIFVSGNTRLGDASGDTIDTQGSFSNNIMPSTNATFNIGTNLMRFNEVHAVNVHSTFGYFDGSVQVSGNLVVAGNLVTTNVQSVIISDPLIYLAGNNYSSDLVDIGFVGNYFDGATNRHAGVFRKASTDEFYVFKNYTPEPTTTVNIADPSFVLSTLNTYLKSGALTTNATHVVVTANSTVNVSITANSLTLSSPLAVTSGGTGLASYTSGDILIANTGNVLSKLALGSSGYVLQSNGTAVVYDTLDGGTF